MAKLMSWKVLLVLVCLLALAAYGLGRYTGMIQRNVYEYEPPELPEYTRPAVLVLTKANGFVHRDAMPAGENMLRDIARAQGWDITLTDNAATHNAQDLARFKAVVWNNVSGDVLTPDQRAALKSYIEHGGGWVGIHAAGGDPKYKWQWYVDTLIGAQFAGHTMHPQFQDADVLRSELESGMTAHLPDRWRIAQEEWYAFDQNPRNKGYDILLTLDEDSYSQKGESIFGTDTMPGEHPITWRHSVGQGRVFYTAIGHQAVTYQIPEFQALITEAIRWAGTMP